MKLVIVIIVFAVSSFASYWFYEQVTSCYFAKGAKAALRSYERHEWGYMGQFPTQGDKNSCWWIGQSL